MTYALRIIMVAEFDRDCGSARGNENCQDLLEAIDAVPEETWWNWIVLVLLFVVFRFTALAILQKKDPSSTELRPIMLVDGRAKSCLFFAFIDSQGTHLGFKSDSSTSIIC
jgi:hypothetical protein